MRALVNAAVHLNNHVMEMMENISTLDLIATVCFGLALLHTFLVKQFQRIGSCFPSGSVGENVFHLLGEVEVVFGFWAGLYLGAVALVQGGHEAIEYLEGRDFTEPAFVFVIMTVCSTKPILELASRLIELASRLLPFQAPLAFYVTTLTVGPLLGSFITEPAAMTVTALILWERYYNRHRRGDFSLGSSDRNRPGMSEKLMYATIGLLFVNVSIGGTLTPYAAPPILMVAPKWNWDLAFMITHFGWKSVLAIVLSTSFIAFRFRREFESLESSQLLESSESLEALESPPPWVWVIHLLFLGAIVASAHHMVVFVGLFLFFLGLVTVTKEYQNGLKLKEGLLVAFFLGGLVVLGGPQRWWLEPILTRLDALPLFSSAILLTAITDNAALTYLGAQVPTLSDVSKYALVAGSVVGGGLTVIANAPNPAGYGILNPAFGEEGISPLRLFLNALPPTLIAALCLWFL